MNTTDFERLCESIEQAGEIRQGTRKPSRVFRHAPKATKEADGDLLAPTPTLRATGAIDVRHLRERLNLTQSSFAKLMGISKGTLQNWEQGRRKPRGTARTLLRIVERKPKAVLEALHA